MKKFCVLLVLLFVCFVNSVVGQQAVFQNVESKNIADGIEYVKYQTAVPCVMYVIKFDPHKVQATLEPAQGQREPVASIAQRTTACVAVNGSNYRRGGRYNGNRVNLMKAHGVLYSDVQFPRGTIGWNASDSVWAIDYADLSWNLRIGSEKCSVDRINQPRKFGESVVYTPTAEVDCLRATPGVDIVINNNRVIAIVPTGFSTVPSQGCIYQVDVDNQIINKIAQGMSVSLAPIVPEKNALQWNACDFLLGGAGLILRDGKVLHDEIYAEFSKGKQIFIAGDEVVANFNPCDQQEVLIEQRHPRTALGIGKDGAQYIVVVDGRNDKSIGMSLVELAEFMKTELGCVQALNIGGGGCTTLVINGKVSNNPSQNPERPVSEAVCLFPLA